MAETRGFSAQFGKEQKLTTENQKLIEINKVLKEQNQILKDQVEALNKMLLKEKN